MKLTPEYIRDSLNSVSPAQKKLVSQSFLDQEVLWDVKYVDCDDGFFNKEGLSCLQFSDIENPFSFMMCYIRLDDFPVIKYLPKNTPVTIKGKIESIDNININLKDIFLYVKNEEDHQKYFSEGSKSHLIDLLELLLFSAADIKIADPYMSIDMLDLLEKTKKTTTIKLLDGDKHSSIYDKIKAFNTYFDRDIDYRRANHNHDRFYIIDDVVYVVGSSLKGGGKATFVTKMFDDVEAQKMRDDFEIWWNGAKIITK